jgi:protocadherin Fat 4
LVGITVSATDADLGDSVTYSLDDSAGGRFAISASGVVTLNGGVDAEFASSHDIVVRATSTDGSTTTATFTIAITNVNEFDISAISDADAAENTVAENSAAGTAVGITAAATDPDFGVTVAYSLDDDADGLFAVDAAGVVTLVGSVDAETATSHDIVVRATSSDGSTTTASFTIAVTNVDEFAVSEVVDADEADDAVAENSAAGAAVGITASATDGDLGDTVTYSLDDDAGGLFAIDAAGVVTLVGSVDAETASSHDIVVRAASSDGSFSTATFTIAVTNVDEFDIAEIVDADEAANEVTENSAVGTAVGITASATDADAGVTVSYSLDDDAGGLFAIDATTGVVTVAGTVDFEAASSHTIVVRATSTDGSTNVQSFEIAVSDVPNPTGDTNGDEVVDLVDLNNVRNNFGATGEDVLGDTNGDGVVDLDDLNAVRNNFGATEPQDAFRAVNRVPAKGTSARETQFDLASPAVQSRGSQESDQDATTDAIFDAWPESSFVANARAKARIVTKAFRSF